MSTNHTVERTRTRIMKVYYYRPRRQTKWTEHPAIRIEEKYLQQFGFKVGDRIEVKCQRGKISIRKL